MVEPALEAVAGLARWFVGVTVLPVCGYFQRRRQHSANHSAQSPASVSVASLGHEKEYYMFRCSLYNG